MAGAYAALMSLMHTSELVLHPSQKWLCIQGNLIESLIQKVHLLQEFLEDYSHRDHEEMAALECRIADMAYAADSAIDCHVWDRIQARCTGDDANSSTSFSEYIQNLIEMMEDLIKMEVMRIRDAIGTLQGARPLIDFSPAVSSRLAPKEQNTLVGSDQKLIEIVETLTGDESDRQIIAIVGMGGIGKTNLAKHIYEHPYIAQHFDIRSWATVSQNYNPREMILEMLSEIDRNKQDTVLCDKGLHRSNYDSLLGDDHLGLKLYKTLYGKKYLVVLDDLWSMEAWYKIRALLPDNCGGSQIMITTRLFTLARELRASRHFEMDFLDGDQSWRLLCDKVFGKEDCPSELEELGKDIAKKCRGLPLAIVVIGGLLAKSNKTREVWEDAVENLNSMINSVDDENCLKILYLSYKNLPIHLKPCFIYIATLYRDRKLQVPNLASLLVGEGFLKPVRGKSLEEVADEYITELIERNLIFVGDSGVFKKFNFWGTHDLLRDLCVRQAQKEKFRFVMNEGNRGNSQEEDLKRSLCFHLGTHNFLLSGPQVPDLLSEASLMESTIRVFSSRVMVWRVLQGVEEFSPVQEEIIQLPFLRLCYLHSRSSDSAMCFIPPITQFWCLQSLYVDCGSSDQLIILPSQIWDMPLLRHIISDGVALHDPPVGGHNPHILENLQTLSGVLGFRCTDEVLKRAPNLKTLRGYYGPLLLEFKHHFCLHNLVHLCKLEYLFLHSTEGPLSLDYLSFPLSLKQLTLNGGHLPWEDVATVGSLPNLEILVLNNYAFEGPTWCPVDGHFDRLKVLAIIETDLLHWRADKTHFPILEHLILRQLNLEELPQNFGEHSTLRKIEVSRCSDSTYAWAEQIREEQENLGNEGLQVIVENAVS